MGGQPAGTPPQPAVAARVVTRDEPIGGISVRPCQWPPPTVQIAADAGGHASAALTCWLSDAEQHLQATVF